MSILKIENLKKVYIKDKKEFVAVNNVNLHIKRGESVGLVGESGCGKSTIAKLITGIEKITDGNIFFNDLNIKELKSKERRQLYNKMQMIFQNPMDSFNPRIKLGNSIGEIKINLGMNKKDIKKEVLELLHQVGLNEEYYYRYPNEVSGGQCQRAAIARAILINPEFIVCDEATSALDVSIQGQIINLLKNLQEKRKISFLFISHDLALVQKFCDRIYVMYEGQIVEEGSRNDIINNPRHPYTKLLLSSNFSIYEDEQYNIDEFEDINLEVSNNNKGCKFYNRCPFRLGICKDTAPSFSKVQEGHYALCHLV